jgi:hypothetical protein
MSFMCTFHLMPVITAFITLSFPIASQAAGIEKHTQQVDEISSQPACAQGDQEYGLSIGGSYCGSDCSFIKRLCCCYHPTTLSYHPEIYNYRHYFNIVGHETWANASNYRHSMPAANRPESIPAPVPEKEIQLLPKAGSARLSGPNQKNLLK